jgi:hemerythrin-like domain-containing protein
VKEIAVNSVERLKAEHELIERGLKLLEEAVARIDAERPLPEGFPQWAPRFFQQFADQCHHAKEEDVFFPLLKQRGIPEHGGPIGVMLHEHVLGRDCVGRMRQASEARPFDARAFADAARQYVPLLRQHIFKENNVLFRMAEMVMSQADDAEVTGRFASVEQERGLTDLQASFAKEVAGWEGALAGERQA